MGSGEWELGKGSWVIGIRFLGLGAIDLLLPLPTTYHLPPNPYHLFPAS